MEQNRSVIVVNIEAPIRILKFFLPGLQKPMMTLAPLFPKNFPKVKHIMLLNQKRERSAADTPVFYLKVRVFYAETYRENDCQTAILPIH